MTQEEKQEIINAVLQQIKAQSSDITELPTATSLDNVKSLPAMQGSSLVSAPLSLLIQGISLKNEGIYDLGIVADFNEASTKAAERTITEDGKVHIILWRSADGNSGDSSTILQSRWGTYYVCQVVMFDGQERVCRYRLITTGENYSVGEWNDLLLPSEIDYNTISHQVQYRGIRPGIQKTLFEIPVADETKPGLIRIGGPFYVDVDNKLQISTGEGIRINDYNELTLSLAEDGGLATDGGKLKIEEGWRPVPQGKRSATPADNCFVYATDDPNSKSSVLNAPDTLLRQKDGHLMFQKGMWNPGNEDVYYTRNQVPVATDSCDGVMSSDDKRNLNNLLNPKNASGLKKLGDGIYISTGAGITINAYNNLVLNLADNGGLVINNDDQLTINVPKLKEMLGLN